MDAKIKAILPVLFFMLACSGGSGSSGGDSAEPAITEMQLGVTQTATIETEGDVDTFHIRATEANRFLNVNCNEKSSGSGVELMVTVFEEDASGRRVRLFGKHKPQDATPPADLDMAIYIDRPKELYITVRDLMDDDASTDIAYHLTCAFMESSRENHDFSNAQALNIDTSDVYYDAIELVGEVDCFTFSPVVAGVYRVSVDHVSQQYISSNVQLSAELWDASGDRIQAVSAPNDTILSFLDPDDGPYYVTAHDSDDMHVDAAATYAISVGAVEADETLANDTEETALALSADAEGAFSAEGAIEYASSSASEDHGPDIDWYRFALSDSLSEFQTVRLDISNQTGTNPASILRVVVYDEALDIVTSHDFYCSGAPYENRFRTRGGVHYVSVTPLNPGKLEAGAGYQVRLQPTDLGGDDNNTENDATELQSGVEVEGAVDYHSDVDWYSLMVDTSAAGVIAVDLVSDSSIIDYQLSIWRGVEMIKRISDLSGAGAGAHLKTAIFVPRDSQGSAVYHIKVGDAQNDEGSDVPYRLTTVKTTAPVVVGAIPEIGAGDVLRYYNESDEQSESGGPFSEVELEIFSGYQPTYLANTDWLDFRNGILPDGVETAALPDGATRITFPWIAGYIDYQGDRDMFRIDFGKLSPDGEETAWYYDVEMRLVVPQPGSDVEYVWKLYRDRNQNGVIMDDPTSPDGYKACAGDDDPEVREGLDVMVPTGDQTFWIGSEWGENAKFYFGVGDFNYEVFPDSGEPPVENLESDDDWGYDAPYYFKLQLTYHPGEAWPD